MSARGDVLGFFTDNLPEKICLRGCTKKAKFTIEAPLTSRDKALILAGGELAAARKKQSPQ
jgi:hypothetical protein